MREENVLHDANIHLIFAVLLLYDTKSCQCACVTSTVRNSSIGRDVLANFCPIRIEHTDVFLSRQKILWLCDSCL